MLEAMVQLEARLPRVANLKDDLGPGPEDVAHAYIVFAQVSHRQVFAKPTDLEEVLTVRQLPIPCLVVRGAVHVESFLGASVHLILDFIANQARLGDANLALARLLVDSAFDLHAGQGADLARPDAEEDIGGGKRRDIVGLGARGRNLSQVQ